MAIKLWSNTILFVCIALNFSTTSFARWCPREVKITVGTYTYQSWLPTSAGKGVSILKLTKNNLGVMKLIPNMTTGENPAYCAKAPHSLYCVNENGEGTVTEIKHGRYRRYRTNAGGSTHLAVYPSRRGTRVFVANYGGAVSSLLLGKNGKFTLYNDTIEPGFASARTGQQAEPHPHMILYIGGPHIMVPDLGSDRLWTYVVGWDSELLWRRQFKMRNGDGPRHAVRGRGYNLYVVNEISNTVARVRGCYGSKFHMCQRFSLDRGISKNTNGDAAAAIRISRDYRYLYASLRRDGVAPGAIAVFKLARSGKILSRVGLFQSGGVHPRDFNIIENAPDCHSYIAVANRDSDNIVLFRRDRVTGEISRTPSFQTTVHTPTSVLV